MAGTRRSTLWSSAADLPGWNWPGAISDIAQLYMRHDFRHIDPAKSRVLLLDGGPRVLAAYPPDLSAKAEKI